MYEEANDNRGPHEQTAATLEENKRSIAITGLCRQSKARTDDHPSKLVTISSAEQGDANRGLHEKDATDWRTTEDPSPSPASVNNPRHILMITPPRWL
ncbi:hypothetical protein ACJRO7_015459 [Eucalyptus globulus]|uniref:Uncharacterized protein n=1 Tax=Eucalyptus globulus TaxID=34317 RepID=A0ABD3L487_EUCGL